MSEKKRNMKRVNRMIKASVLTTQVFNLANPYMLATFAAESPNSEIVENADIADGFATGASPLNVASSVYMQAQMEEPPHYTWLSPHQESGVSLSANLSMLFSEDVELGTGRLTVHQWDGTEVGRIDVSGGSVAGGAIRISGQYVSMHLDHPLSDNTRYYVEVSSGMFVDRGGQGSNAVWDKSMWNFVTAEETAPKLVSKSPEGLYLSGVGPGQAYFEMEFNEPVRWNHGYVRLHEASGGVVVRELRISGAGDSNRTYTVSGQEKIAQFMLSGGLEEGKPYYVEITSGALTDMAMNPYGGMHTPEEWTFRTGDMQPYYTDLYPQGSGQRLMPSLTMVFSEEMRLGAGHLTVYQWDGTEVGRIDVSGGTVAGGAIRISGQYVSMHLDHPLSDNTRYYVEVSSGMFVDRGGQGSNSVWDKSLWNFVTAEETAPKLVSKSPKGLYLSGVGPGKAYFNMEFNESVRWNRGYVRLHEASGGAVVRELWISGAGDSNGTYEVSGQEKIAQFMLSGGLEEGKPYYVEITSGTLTDMAMNPYAGIHTPQEWTFCTGDMQPYYTDLYPRGSGQRLTPSLTMVFSEEMRLGTGQLTVHQWDGTEVGRIDVSGGTVAGGTVQISGQHVSMKLDHPLSDNTRYYVEVSSGMFVDRGGQGSNGIWDESTWNFVTADETAPKLVSKLPEGLYLSGVSLGQAYFEMKFNEPVRWDRGYVRLHEASGGAVVRELWISGAGDSNWMSWGDEKTAFFTLSGGLEEGKPYYVEITSGALTDMAMNPYAGMHTPEEWTFRTGDMQPYYTDLYPQGSGQRLTPSLTMVFSEEMRLGAGHLTVHQWDGTEVGRIDVSGGTVAGGAIRISGQYVSMMLDHPLSDNTWYYVEVNSGMFVDRGGQGSNAVWDKSMWNFVTAEETAPKLVSKTPEGLYLSGVSPGKAYFNMEFNEPVRWNRGYVRLHEASGGAVVRELWISGAGDSNRTYEVSGQEKMAYFMLSGGLEEGKPYYVEITSGALTDSAMNPYAGMNTPEEWTFRTGDMQPYYTDLYPQGSGQRLTPSLTMVFSEEMRLGAGHLTVYQWDGTEVGRIDVSGGTVAGGAIRISGQYVSMMLDHPLSDNTRYYVEVNSGMFVDRGGQGSNAVWDKSMWNFVTAEETAPKLVSKTPEGLYLSGVSPGKAYFNMEFNEPVKWNRGYVRLHEASGGAVVRELWISGAGDSNRTYEVLGQEKMAYFMLSGGLEEGKPYYVEITSGALTDMAMNPYAGMHTPEEWTFRTGDERPHRSKDKETSDQDTSSAASQTESKTGVVLTDAKTVPDKGSTIQLIGLNDGEASQALNVTNVDQKELVVDASGYNKAAKVNIPSAFLKEYQKETKKVPISIRTDVAQFTLSTELVDKLVSLYPEDNLIVEISALAGENGTQVRQAIADTGLVGVVVNPVDFKLMAGNQEITEFFGNYVERKLILDHEVDPEHVAAVWFDPKTGALLSVPVLIRNVNGHTEAIIKSNHNSIYAVVSADKKFKDLENHWAQKDVEMLANKLIVKGVQPDIFEPNRAITRAEFVALLVRGLGMQEKPLTEHFTDVKENAWYAGSIGAAMEAGLIRGYGNQSFGPEKVITREEIAVITEKAAHYVQALNAGPASEKYKEIYSDASTVSPWAQEAVAQATEQGLIKGVSPDLLAPKQQANRVEATSILKRFLQLIKFTN
ncbi:Ig-like domain-containing protein [Paenibacillus kribbensis]|uniref:Ig-like domain-containing protein n=1 Tax=Paenibacillus kribbensis TaxID=172713 RepID=UPI002DBC1F8C|nr:Ig-like domain-containing protein [Paenibacillus kribbensis]MEC0238103.1 Ig-like domain-containing protein [Paenibacillus kribbensis]